MKSKNSYRQVLKATSLFGGVQVFKIIIAVVRSKVIALLIGATGMGIASLLVSTMDMINGFTNFGLDRSAVRDISLAKESGDTLKINKTISVLQRLIWFTAILGALVMILFASLLSELAFESTSYTFAFMWLGIALVFKQLTSGRMVILQGLRHLQSLAKANVFGNLLALIVTLPLYYYLKLDGIVPAIIVSSMISFLVVLYMSYKKTEKTQVSTKEAFVQGKGMLLLGLTLSFSSLITLIAAYVLRIFISTQNGLAQVGLYSAGFVILNTYVGMVFTAMGTDYFPRLAAISEDIEKIRKTVHEQANVAVLLILPIAVVFLALAPFIIRILYSSEFDPILLMVSWGILGMVFKAVSFSMGYIIIAKGDAKVFMTTAVIFNTILLTLNILGYYFYGLTGLGVSFFVYYMIHFIGIRMIVSMRYQFSFLKGFYQLFVAAFSICLITFLLTFIENVYLKYGLLLVAILFSIWFALFHLNKRMNLKEVLQQFMNRKK